jgi:outer membrane protein OmpA-like peptidoglycan-associated protein
MIAEFSYESEKVSGLDGPIEATAGFQYFITPHLTMNFGTSIGLSDASPDWRILMGLSTCQGVGTFNRPVPKLVDPDEVIEEPVAPIKVSKIRALTPLLTKIAIADSPVSHLEVPVDYPNEGVTIDPSDRLIAPQMRSLEASPLDPMGAYGDAEGAMLPELPFPAKVRRRFRFPELAYELNQWDLSDEGRKSLSMVAEELRKENKFFVVSIEGHTDDVGSETYNRTLSFKRAVAAATHMVIRDGFDPARIFVKGFGESRPIENNESAEGRAKNRRVELLILVPEGYEDIDIETPVGGFDSASLRKGPFIDPLAIEQAIIEKTGAATARPAGTFSQIDRSK